jgi:hypothetical protein
MKHQNDLFDLIQSMSKSEKRYFSLDAKKSGRNSSRYLDLFKAINQMEAYEEGRLRRKFGNSLPTDKHYLYNAILKSMRDYNSSKSRAARIKEMLLDAKYLYKRGLYHQSEERLEQAKALARDLDDQLALLEISREQLNYVWTMKQGDYGSKIEDLLADKDEYIHHINEELRYLSLAYKIQVAKEQPQAADRKASSAAFADQLQAESAPLPSTAHAQRRFLQSHALLNDLIGDVEQANTYYAKMVEWWDEYPHIKDEEYNRYLADAFNLLHASYSQKKYDQFEQLLTKIQQEEAGSYHDQVLVFKQLTNYQLLYHINLGIEEGHERLLERVEEGMSTYKLNPVSQLIIAFNVTVLLLILEQHQECRTWADKVLQHYNRKVESEQFRLATLLIRLMSTYSMDDIDDFDSGLRALQRSLRQQKAKTPTHFFKTCAKYLRKLYDQPSGERKSTMKEFSDLLEQYKIAPPERIPLGLDDLMSNWLESRIKKQSLRVVLRTKTKAEI